ncbi:Hypothetical protein NTJ_00833 [Nesidiocoris tenuis]|uniref:Uncharacterized protein n=1 Tax=Nesidiocoris tenuis TaxID=355587 RepID=A0ABN7ACP1_9HEMI|nr:Hypothetical protein NTJ_00833 [Nesidiocoris tenuis]
MTNLCGSRKIQVTSPPILALYYFPYPRIRNRSAADCELNGGGPAVEFSRRRRADISRRQGTSDARRTRPQQKSNASRTRGAETGGLNPSLNPWVDLPGLAAFSSQSVVPVVEPCQVADCLPSSPTTG